ncbi:MAG TPA: SAM-dependent methyltransferase [Actinomycetota bacterium]|nr:SAM-dependent methyltransferase [Actinomycetota bacterium]
MTKAFVAPTLRDELSTTIRGTGPIDFAAFMDVALYDPDDGFYARPPVGEEGHFVTSPHVSPAFGDLLARQVAGSWEALGRPRPFDLVEVGAGDGTLALQILTAARTVPELADAIRYTGVERTPGVRAALEASGLPVRTSLEDVGSATGMVLANEVLDNLPFHRLRERDGRLREVYVGLDGDRLIEVEDEPSAAALAALGDRRPGPGRELPVSPAAAAMVRRIAGVLERGHALLFDYGFTGRQTPGPVHAYRDHRVLAEVLEDPGSRDVTAAVDLDAVADEARRSGLQVWGPVTQRQALLGLGYRLWASGVRARQTEAEVRGDWREANRLYAARSRASILIDGAKLGGLWLLAFGTEGLPAPAAALGDRQIGC